MPKKLKGTKMAKAKETTVLVSNKTDQKTLDLIKEIKRRKDEIAKISKPSWLTNCNFSYSSGGGPLRGDVINLQVEANVKNLISIAAFLQEKEESYNRIAKLLEVEDVPDFTWDGFSVAAWITDIKSRINKVQIGEKKKKLEALEARARSVISPELQRELEIAAIMDELK